MKNPTITIQEVVELSNLDKEIESRGYVADPARYVDLIARYKETVKHLSLVPYMLFDSVRSWGVKGPIDKLERHYMETEDLLNSMDKVVRHMESDQPAPKNGMASPIQRASHK